MKKLLLDINILLDVVLERMPWAPEGALLLSALENGTAEGFVAAHTVPTVYYLISKDRGKAAANAAVSDILRLIRVVPLQNEDFQKAMILEMRDYEDAIQAVAALRVGCDFIVSRNSKDYRRVSIPVRTAGEVLAIL